MSLRMRTRPVLGIIEPCLPSPAKQPPAGSNWIYEIKHDGFRIMARHNANGVRLYTRNGYDFAGRFPQIVDAGNLSKADPFAARYCWITLRIRAVSMGSDATEQGIFGKETGKIIFRTGNSSSIPTPTR